MRNFLIPGALLLLQHSNDNKRSRKPVMSWLEGVVWVLAFWALTGITLVTAYALMLAFPETTASAGAFLDRMVRWL